MTVQDSAARAAGLALPAKAALILLAAMSSIPFLLPHHLDPIPSFAGEWLAAALGLLACLSLLTIPRTWQSLRVPAVALVPLGLLVVVGVQVAAGKAVYWQHHMLVGLYLLWASMMMVLGSALRQQAGVPRVVTVIAWSLLVAGVASAVIVGLQVAGVEPAGWVFKHGNGGYSANLAQTNQLASLLGMALAGLLYLRVSQRIGKWQGAVLALTLLFALALTGSRSGWLYLIALVVFSAFAWRSKSTLNGGMLLRDSLFMISAFAAMQFALPILLAGNAPPMPADRIVTASAGPSIRLQLLEVAWRTFMSSPWLGVGVGQFAWNDFLLAEAVPHTAGMATHAHNLFLHLLAETGLAGTLVVLSGLAWWLFASRRAEMTPERWWLLAVLGILFIHGMLEYPLWYAYFLGITALLLGLGDEKSIEQRMDLGPVVALALVAFGALSLANLGINERKLEYWFALGKAGKLTESQLHAFAADASEIRGKSLLAPYADAVTAIVLQLDRQEIDAKLAVTAQATRISPTASLVYKQAALLALKGERKAAMSQLYLALARHPGMAKSFHRHLFKQVLKGETRLLPLLMVVQEHLPPAPKLKHSSSGKTPDLNRETPP